MIQLSVYVSNIQLFNSSPCCPETATEPICQRIIFEIIFYKPTFTWIIEILKLLNSDKIIILKFHTGLKNKHLDDHGFAFLNWIFSQGIGQLKFPALVFFFPFHNLLGHSSIQQVHSLVFSSSEPKNNYR